ncbi:hypothetical protein O3M35_008344 [Rhynocoris fuscipes]|uniref:Venom serine carboxypeptidase n=1 Tax=Rhynocoris fuscipes TaxID=488301 RepID=A0AAW1D8K9_9HEMI
MKFSAICVYFISISSIEAFLFNPLPRIESKAIGDDYGKPLFLTPYLERGDIHGAQIASSVKPLLKNIKSYSGFLTVDKIYNSNLFFWFFPAEIDNTKAPVLLWLQGGPGTASTYGLFNEHGPFYFNNKSQLIPREYYWSKKLNVLYIDNPVGTGFSFTENEKGYATNQTYIAENLYKALIQFFQLFPQYSDNDFYATGESYAGKYVPTLAYKIHTENRVKKKINLKGISVGNGACDPITMMGYDEYLYNLGLIDIKGKSAMKQIQNDVISLVKQNRFNETFPLMNRLKDLYFKLTGFKEFYNYITDQEPSPFGDLEILFNNKTIRKILHVGNLTHHNGDLVMSYLQDDMMKSVKPYIEVLLEHYKVLIYNGQLDIVLAYPLTINFIHSLNWTGVEQYRNAERKLWYVDNELAGYTKTAGKFTEVLVRNAGHMVPSDQPKWAYDLITKFTNTS